ncbi:MAG TPA: hypothetical protein VMT71_01060 [Syntrophorhabdales bacterium]|nr:hypothetical protein [Syntrophorhabdales bacterium]
MRKRLLIIQPIHYRSRSDLTLHKTRKRNLVGLTLPYLAGITPQADGPASPAISSRRSALPENWNRG